MSGTVGDNVARASGVIAAAGGGKVLQVVANTDTPSVETSSTSYVHITDIPTLNFTPSATSSKVLLIASFGGGEIGADNGYVTLCRDTTNLGAAGGFSTIQHSSSHRFPLGGAVFLDSPNTTSQVTYDIRIKSEGNTFRFGSGCSVSLVAIEIGA